VAECETLVDLHDQRLDAMRRMERAKAVALADVDAAQEAYDTAREGPAATEKRLAAEREWKPWKPK